MIFMVLLGKMIFLFPENMILLLGQKMKDDLSKKNTWKYDILFKCSEKMVFSERSSRNMVFLVLSGKTVFFSRECDVFSLDRKWKITFHKKYAEVRNFLYIRTSVTNLTSRPTAKKNQKWSYPAKIHLKVIEILDLRSRKSSNNSLYFYGDLYRRFHILLSSEKKRKLNI